MPIKPADSEAANPQITEDNFDEKMESDSADTSRLDLIKSLQMWVKEMKSVINNFNNR